MGSVQQDPADLLELYKEAARLADRTVEVERTTDGKFVVIWFNHNYGPPPKRDTEESALQGFIEKLLKIKELDATMGAEDTEKGNEDADRTESTGGVGT